MRLLVNHARRAVLLGKEMRAEHFLSHRRRQPVAPPRRQRRHDHRAVHEALVVRREDHRAVEIAQVLEPLDADPGEHARQRQNPGREVDAADRARGRAAGPVREVDRLGRRRLAGRGALDQRSQLTEILRAGKRAFVDARLERVLERDHQLDPIQRAQPQLLQRGLRREVLAAGVFRDQRRERVGALLHQARRGAAVLDPLADRGALELARAVGARQLGLGPDERAADLLMVVELGVGLAHHRVRVDRRVRGPAPRARALRIRSARRPRLNRARPGITLSTRSTSSGNTLSPSGVTIISFLRPRM